MPDFEFVVSHDTKHSGPGFDVYAADVLAFSPYGGPGTVLDHVEVTLATGMEMQAVTEEGTQVTIRDASLDLYTAAALAEQELTGPGHRWTVVDHITAYGSHGRGQMGRAL